VAFEDPRDGASGVAPVLREAVHDMPTRLRVAIPLPVRGFIANTGLEWHQLLRAQARTGRPFEAVNSGGLRRSS